jgi:hypothetical protein
MSENPDITRRQFVAAACVLGVVPVIASFPWPSGTAVDQPRSIEFSSARLTTSIANRESAAVVGNAYICAMPSEQSADVIVRSIFRDLAIDFNTLSSLTQPRIEELLSLCIREDFAQSRSVNLNGWILSCTEARLYALVALT